MFRCKFQVADISKDEGYDNRVLRLQACVNDDGDNQDWSKWTPSGSFEMTVTNEAAFEKIDALKPGDIFYIDLTKLEAAA